MNNKDSPMSKIKLSIIALSCVMALSACSSSSKGGTDNSETNSPTRKRFESKK